MKRTVVVMLVLAVGVKMAACSALWLPVVWGGFGSAVLARQGKWWCVSLGPEVLIFATGSEESSTAVDPRYRLSVGDGHRT